MSDSRTLSSTQIRYLRIGPKINQSKLMKQQLIEALQEQKKQQGVQFSLGNGNLNRIPKFSYGQMPKTVNNFGVLLNQNFGNQSTLHQMQKFGKLAKEVDKIMQKQKDQPLEDIKRNSGSRMDQQNDKRTFIKSIYNYQGQKLFVVLHSFSIEAVGQQYKQILPFSYLKLLVSRVSSAKLTRIIQSAFHFQTQDIQINYQKIYEKTSTQTNSQQKYQSLMSYKFQKLGTEIKINLPYLEFLHVESDFKHVTLPDNADILTILNEQFDNVHDIVYKYFDHQTFGKQLDSSRRIEQIAVNELEESALKTKYEDQPNEETPYQANTPNHNQEQKESENHENEEHTPQGNVEQENKEPKQFQAQENNQEH